MKKLWPPSWKRWLAVPVLFVVALGITAVVAKTPQTRVHHIVFQVNSNDPDPMNHAVANSINLVTYYREKNEAVRIEIVAYGAGINMFRADMSPVRDVLQYMHAHFPEIAFTVCGNTKAIFEKREGHALSFIEGTRVVPFGIVRIVDLEESGWSYIRP